MEINLLKVRSLKYLILFLLIINCSKTDSVTGEKILIEPNPQVKARQAVDQGGGIFGDVLKGGKSSNSNTYDFSSSNILWRATLKTLDFMPLLNADYQGGVIIYDWYSDNENYKEQIKVTVRFLNNQLRSDSINIIAHKRICEENTNKCKTIKLDDKFNSEIKDTILTSARTLRIEEEKSKNK
ncbi:MAG: DUF3576 domain-containing protein [Proteobacteria bacterium]|nr:DUF3576 domain-containing protein [Candidatus Fonsibacter sp. PEL4]